MTDDEVKAFWDVSKFLDTLPKNDDRIIPALQTYEALKKKMGHAAYEAMSGKAGSGMTVVEAITNICEAMKVLSDYESKKMEKKEFDERWETLTEALNIVIEATMSLS